MMSRDKDFVYFKIDPKHTNFINRIIEGYEYLGVMSTLDKQAGLAFIRSTKDTRSLVVELLESLEEVDCIFPPIDN